MRFFIFLIILVQLKPSNAFAGKEKGYVVAFYNVENLFDTKDDPTIDDEEFLPQGKNKWTEDKYSKKLQDLATVISQIGTTKAPDVIGLCEIENKYVLEDLIKQDALKKHGYGIIHYNSPDKRGIDVGFLYKKKSFNPISSKIYAIEIPDDSTFKTRDILLVTGILGKKDTVNFLINHFPSRRGGKEDSEKYRMTVANKGRQVIDSLLYKNALAKIIVMGDFNDEPQDKSMTEGFKGKETKESLTSGSLWNLMAALKAEGKGSYFYKGKWDMLDQMLISEGLIKNHKGVKYLDKSATVFSADFMKDQDEKHKGAPFRTYAGSKYLGGYSDHFPIYIKLK